MIQTPRHSRHRLMLPVAVVLLALAGFARGEGEAKEDFFDIVGKSPTEVATAIPGISYQFTRQVASSFVGMPLSDNHRKEFIDALRETLQNPQVQPASSRRCLLNLLEEDGRYDEALEIIRTLAPKSGDEAIREVGLLWKTGREVEAAKQLKDIPNSWFNDEVWLSLVQIDLITKRPNQAMRLLDFLEHQTVLPPRLRHSLALQHLEITRRTGEADKLIERTESAVLRAIWNAALDRKDQAVECINQVTFTPDSGDLELLLLALGPHPLLVEQTKILLARSDVPVEKRRALLSLFQVMPQRFALWSGMDSGHSETADLLELLPTSFQATELPGVRATCLKILDTHPDDGRLQWLMALLNQWEPDKERPYLHKAARAFVANPQSSSSFADPADSALKKLAETTAAADLEMLLTGSPDFDKLPPEDQLRYLMTAQLDLRVLSTLARCKFGEPYQNVPDQLPDYFSQRAYGHVVPGEVIAMLVERLPEFVIDPPSKFRSAPTDRTASWLRFLGAVAIPVELQVKAINRLVAAAGQRSPEIQQAVVAGLPDFAWSLPGLEFSRPEKPVVVRSAPYLPPFAALTIFSPPDPVAIGKGFDQSRFMPPGSLILSDGRGDSTQRLLVESPWSESLWRLYGSSPADPPIQTKLRKLFNDSPSRTVIYDLLVSTGALECPDPAVKAAAARRMAEINTIPQDDPAIAVYWFFQRLNSGIPLDQCLPILENADNFNLAARNRILRSLQFGMGGPRINQVALNAVREKLGFKKPTEVVKPPSPPSAFDRLKFFEEAEKLDSPESVALAKEVLFDFINSAWPKTSPTENMAIFTLVKTGNFETFLNDLKSRLTAAGRSELEIQRALYRVHLYKFVHSKGEIAPFAKRILELDPTDADAAAEVLSAAAREQNRPLALKALETLCRQSRPLLMQAIGYQRDPYGENPPDPLLLFTGPKARELAEALIHVPLPAREPKASYTAGKPGSFYPLYLHFLQHDLESLNPVLRWTGDFSPATGRQLTPLAEGLIRTNHTREAVNLIADAYFTPPADAAADSLRFQTKNPNLLPDSAELGIDDLQRIGILKPVADAASTYENSPATAGVRLMIALAADPTPETWNRLVPPFLAAAPVSSRSGLRDTLENFVKYKPGSAALQQQIARENEVPAAKPLTLDSIQGKLKLAADANDRTPISPLWDAAKPLLTSAAERDRLRFLAASAFPLAKFAGDAEWSEFLEQIRKTPGFADSCVKESGGIAGLAFLTPQRIKDLADVIVPNLKPSEENSYAVFTFFNCQISSGPLDPGQLQAFRPWLDDEIRRRFNGTQVSPRLQFLDLLAGNPAAVSPQLSATAEGNSSWRIAWSLAGYKGYRSGFPFARKFPFLDGQFDLEILAGPFAERLERVANVEKASGTGRLVVKLPDGTRFVTVLARQRGGNIVRMSNPVELASAETVPVQIAPKAINFDRLPEGGPFFFEEAFELTSSLDTTSELAELPWTTGPAPVVSGWILKTTGIEGLMLSFRTAAGEEIKAENLEGNSPELDGMPLWKRFQTTANLMPPAGTEKVVLVFKNSRYGTPSLIRLSEIQVVPPKAVLFPDGLTLLGRVPADVGFVTIDSRANRFATASDQGVGVFDFTTRQFSGWIPLGPPEQQSSRRIGWLALAGDRIFAAIESGEVYLISLSKRTSRIVCKIEDISRFNEIEKSIQLSQDGDFLAWHGLMAGIHLVKINGDGTISERLLETPQIHSLAFDPEKRTLEALGGSNEYSLPLADWEKAALKITGNNNGPWKGKSAPRLTYGQGASVTDPSNRIIFYIKYGEMPAALEINSRVVDLPRGLVGLDQESVPFYISPFGQVLRIDPTKFKGFEPPPGN